MSKDNEQKRMKLSIFNQVFEQSAFSNTTDVLVLNLSMFDVVVKKREQKREETALFLGFLFHESFLV